jgi:hypothetical protein
MGGMWIGGLDSGRSLDGWEGWDELEGSDNM